MSTLAKTLLKEFGTGAVLGWCVGIVTDTSPFTVNINGDTVDIISPPRCSSYTPTLADVVFILRPGSGFLVVDQIV